MCSSLAASSSFALTPYSSENPTPKFGDALRMQVEERLNFFEKGEPPSKNSDAMRKVLDELALDADDDEDVEMGDEEPTLPLLEATPKKDQKKKRKSEVMDVDDEEPSKKVKLSKEERKAEKKAAKKAAKEAAAADVCPFP